MQQQQNWYLRFCCYALRALFILDSTLLYLADGVR